VPREVASVIGAGDTVTAAMAVGIAAELTMVQAARFANVAAAVAVSKAGTAIVTLDEVRKLAEACGRDIEEELEMIRACG
jgi:D-beta-D-heptose 7-phosphate kinase/D-beta-D-heptose 1-phosphate adenosyltransferase